MTRSTRNPKKLRYRLYFWLMDACLLFAAVGFTDFVLDRVFGVEFEIENPVYLTIGVITLFFNFCVAAFLLLARFMRDEYAEILFQRSVVFLAYGVLIVPLLVLVAAWCAYWITGTPGRDSPFAFLYEHNDLFVAFFQLLFGYLVMFVCIFQFLRWRSSR